MTTNMETQNPNSPDKVYNIKGVSWMLKMTKGTSSVCSTNSSHIDQQFKIFKLKDEKKKWKKKINKKFQTVGDQIEIILKNKYNTKQPFDKNYKKQVDIKHTPHLRQIRSFHTSNNSKVFDFDQQTESINFQCRMKTFRLKTQLRNPTKPETSGQFAKRKSQKFDKNSIIQQRQIFDFKKTLGLVKNQNFKVIKTKNLLRIHSKQKKFMQKQNQEFFTKQMNWVADKTQFYKQFDIKNYEMNLIKRKCLQK